MCVPGESTRIARDAFLRTASRASDCCTLNTDGNLVQHLRDADDGDFVIVGEQFDARLGHSRPTHSEKFRSGAFAQGDGKARRVHVAGSFPGGDQDFRWRHAQRRGVSRRRHGQAAGNRDAAPGKGSSNSCSLYWSW